MTTATHAGFLEAICENPHDVAVRLIYADWLEDHHEDLKERRCPRCHGTGEFEKHEHAYRCGDCEGTGKRRSGNGYRERAEFIRVQCELEGAERGNCHCYAHGAILPEDEELGPYCRHCVLRRRERALLEEHWMHWRPRGPAALTMICDNLNQGRSPGCFTFAFRRGFVESVSCRCADWLEHGPELVRGQPVTEAHLYEVTWNGVDVAFPCLVPYGLLKRINNPDEISRGAIAWARSAHPYRGLSALPAIADWRSP